MSIQALAPQAFNGRRQINWFGLNNQPGDAADLLPNAYADDAGVRAVSLQPANPTQALAVSVCGPLGLDCNLQLGMGLLLGVNLTAAPLRLQWAQPVAAVGAFMVAQAHLGTPFTAVMWVHLVGANEWESVTMQGETGPVWTHLGASVAPFVGARAPVGGAIDAVLFDAVHPTQLAFSPLGIGPLYFSEV